MSSGNPIFDSLGLIGVMQRVANDQTGDVTVAASGSFQTVGSSGTSFTLSRQGTVLIICVAQGRALTTPGTSGFVGYQVAMDGSESVTLGNFDYANPGYTSIMGSQIEVLDAGSHTVTQQASVPVGADTLSVFFGSCQVYQLGV